MLDDRGYTHFLRADVAPRKALPFHIHRLGLKWAIFGSFTLALLLILGTLYYVVSQQVENYLTDKLAERASAIAREVKRRAPLKGSEYDEEESRTLTEIAQAERDVRSIILLGPEGRPVAQTLGADVKENEQLVEQFNRNHRVRMQLPNGHLLVAEQTFSVSGPAMGYILVEIDRQSVDEVLRGLRRTVLVALLIGCAVFVALIWAISRVFILRPLTGMMAMASKLSEADLTGRVERASSDELGSMAEALNRIGAGLRDTLSRIRGVSEAVAQVIEQISLTGTTVSSGASTILSRVEETSTSMVQVTGSLRGIAQNVEVLYRSAEESRSSISEMAATNEEVAENVQAMAASVEETTDAIEEMIFSIKEVAKNIQDLYASTEETSTSMSHMDVSISQVEMNANEAARLSEQVSTDAETGVESLRKTLAGIDKIKDSSRAASSVIESLGKRISEIGNILGVIDDVADQTNLLALNAAIIAAQAGEHGKGFAVVADEIKDLAERTGASTKEIAEVIRSVQEESRNAAAAMNQGVRNVEEGVQLGREAEDALKKIFGSANKCTTMTKAIARATVEQARGSKQVTGAIQRIAETVQQISKASNEQAKGTEQIMKSAEKMKVITNHVQRSSQEQARASKQITKAIQNINEMVTHLNQAQKDQTLGSEKVLKAVEAIKSVSEHQMRSVRQLEEAIVSLKHQAEVLRAEIRRYRV
jgi:methyl-accepting chemotaxis protein